MSKQITLTNIQTGEKVVVDKDDYVVGPVKIQKPKGNYITPDKLSGRQRLFSNQSDTLSEAEMDRIAHEVALDIQKNGYGEED